MFLRLVIFWLLAFNFLTGITVFAQNNKVNVMKRKYSPAQLKEDALIMKNAVLKVHPVIGIYRSRMYYEKLFDAFILNLNDSLTEKQFRIRTKMILDELKCGHTEAVSSKEYLKAFDNEKTAYSPYVFLPLNDKVYVLAGVNRKKDTLLKRGEVVRKINGVSVDTMVMVCKKIISTDGNNQSGKDHYLKLGFNSYFPALFGRPDTFTVELDGEKSVRKVKYPTIKTAHYPSMPISPKEDTDLVVCKRASMKYKFLDKDKKTMHLKIYAFTRKRYTKAYRRVFRKMKEAGTENLVIDLRYNGGGSLENTYKLLTYLMDKETTQTLRTGIRSYPDRKYVKGNIFFKLMRFGFSVIATKRTVNDTDHYEYHIKPGKKNHFNGKTYVLINGGSFSASSMVAAYLKANGRAEFIGEETSGAIEGCNAGITPYYKLPNTKIKIRIPAFRIIHDVSPAITGHGIYPDHPITYTIEDVLKRQDLELNKVKELLGLKP